MTKTKLLQKIDGYHYAIQHNDSQWADDVLRALEAENYHKLIPLLQQNKFEDAKTLVNSYFD